MGIAIVNDHSAINRRLREIQAGDVAIPNGIYILMPNERTANVDLRDYDTIFALHCSGILTVQYAGRRDLIRQRVSELWSWVSAMFPSTRRTELDMKLTEEDCERLMNLLRRLRAPPL